ncbi:MULTISPECIES: GNAT family N-acetyltransferase [unclassified Streptomyces]|uniref:GNAT family N-acetyltransferase n=1 Tax=unclassified Streptomyces TaxID=2593676 RepID=UPI002FF083A4
MTLLPEKTDCEHVADAKARPVVRSADVLSAPLVPVEGTALRLRELSYADAAAVLEIFGDSRTTRCYGSPPLTATDARALIDHACAQARHSPRTFYRLGVATRDTDELIGTAKLSLAPPTTDQFVTCNHRAAEFGIALGPDHIHAGLSWEIGHLLGVLAFDRLALHRLWCLLLPTNTPAIRALDKTGVATKEAHLRHFAYIEGAWHDMLQYSILEDDWKTLHQNRPMRAMSRPTAN